MSVPEAVPLTPVAVSATGKFPSTIGVPEISPEPPFTLKPSGKLVAVKLVG